MTELRGKNVVVTGGASGIGRATARKLRTLGAAVTVVDRQDPGDGTGWTPADLGDMAAISVLPLPDRIDVLINAAGLPPRPGREADILRVNLFGLRAFTDHALPRMAEGGAIVSMASKAGGKWRENLAQVKRLLALPMDGVDRFVSDEGIDPVRAYDLSKEAVIVWTKAMVGTLRPRDIRINAVSPAAVETPILTDFMAAFGERATRGVALAGRAGRPEEIAEVIAFLASDGASWVTGCNIECDGGLTATLEAEALGLTSG